MNTFQKLIQHTDRKVGRKRAGETLICYINRKKGCLNKIDNLDLKSG